MKTLRPFFSYYGGKWNASRYYPAPRYDLLVEPFAGSAGYSLRHWQSDVLLVEKYGVVADLWAWLIEADEREIMALPDLDVGQSVDDVDVRPEARSLIGFWVNGAAAMPHKTLSKWARAAMHQLFWGPRVRERVARQLPAIRHWTVVRASYDELPNAECTWFVDPPYSNSAGRSYVHREIDYDHLGAWCREREGQVIACENEGADWLPFEPFGKFKGQSKRGVQVWSREVVWCEG